MGVLGPVGPTGPAGADGQKGEPGSGERGSDGTEGQKGEKGEPGSGDGSGNGEKGDKGEPGEVTEGGVIPFEPFSATHTQSQEIINSELEEVFLQQFVSPSTGEYTHVSLFGSTSNDNINYTGI